MLIDLMMIAVGLTLLYMGGEGLLAGSISIARRLGLSKLLVSAIIIGFGTSMPELTVSVGAALKGSTEIALGNIIGSNIANTLLIIGVAAVFVPISLNKIDVRRDVYMMLVSTGILAVLIVTDHLNFLSGSLMFALLTGFIFWSYKQDKKTGNPVMEHIEEDFEPEKLHKLPLAIFLTVIGFAALMGGAHLLVEGAVSIARGYGISEAVIGLTLVALGTSLPELATAIVACLKRHGDVVIGNILGSNIFNIMAILSVTSMIKPIPVPGRELDLDLAFLTAVTVFFAALLFFAKTINRLVGSLMLTLYVAYIVWLYL